jgi:hypothetical protein
MNLDRAASGDPFPPKASPQDPALCKGLQGVQEAGSDQEIDNPQLNSIDTAAIQEEDS